MQSHPGNIENEMAAAVSHVPSAADGQKDYSVLIRTYNCAGTLPAVLASLQGQDCRYRSIVVVDSGSTDETLRLCPSGAIVHRYEGKEFNYSASLNQGLRHSQEKYTLIISSHTTLENADAVRYAIDIMESDPSVGAAYFVYEDGEKLDFDLIDKTSFNGGNGLWNTCSIVRTALAKERPFRPEVFAAEDQEWASWLFFEKGMRVARICGGGLRNHNPRRLSYRKRLNDYLGVACFSNRRLLSWGNIIGIFRQIIVPRCSFFSVKERVFMMVLFVNLLACRLGGPKRKSRYF